MKSPQAQTTEATTKLKDKSLEIIRVELNLEQWAIWQPSNSHTAPKSKVLTREITLPDGSKATARVEVLPTIKGALTTEDQKTFYALIKQWEERGRMDTLTPFSLQQLARLLKKKWGTRNIETITQSLMRLFATSFFWTNSYHDSTTGETAETVEGFRILGDLKIARRKKDGNITYEAGYFRFYDLVLTNLKNNHTKPVIYETAISFRSEIAQLIYGRVDRFLVDKTQYERRTKELFDDLGLEGKAYIHASKRKQMLEPALKELTGKPLTTGRITSASLESTADGKDYKVVFRKGARSSHLRVVSAPPPQSREANQPTTDSKANDQAIDLVKYFYNCFFGTENHSITPNSKPTRQAAQLIARHGYDQAMHIVDYAHRAAKETNFQIQTFGGILQYEGRAIAQYEEYNRWQQQRIAREAEELESRRLEEEHREYCQQAIDAYIAEHSEEMPERIKEMKHALLQERRSLYIQWPAQTFTDYAERMVRRDIMHDLNLPTFGDYYDQHRSREEASPQTTPENQSGETPQ